MSTQHLLTQQALCYYYIPMKNKVANSCKGAKNELLSWEEVQLIFRVNIECEIFSLFNTKNQICL